MEVHEEVPMDIEVPVEVHEEVPMDIEVPVEVHAEAHVEVHEEAPVEVHEEVPVEVHEEVPVEVHEEVPVDIEVPIEVHEEAPVDIEEPVEAPVDIEEPVEAPVDIEEPVEVPVEEVPIVEAHVDIEIPVEDPVEEEPQVIIPKLIFIVPYRDREQQQRFFDFQMKKVLEDYKEGEYLFIYSHQNDQRTFNRGAMKNLGFLYAKSIFPNDYQNITFVFNDVDTMPYTKDLIKYETTPGNVKHFYGYTFTLGGIVSIKGSDFERTNGFPNYWAWGYEDNAFQLRVKNAGLTIDRSQFYPILDQNILQLKDGIIRVVNRGEFDRYSDELLYNKNADGFRTIYNVSYSFDTFTGFLHVTNFQTPIVENPQLNKVHDMREGSVPFKPNSRGRRGATMQMVLR